MNGKNFVTLYLITIGIFIASCRSNIQETSPSKPNIIIVYADDLGWADVGYKGSTLYETPNLDQMASEGLILNRFYPSAANCAPSRACMLTGTFSPRHHVYLPQGLSRGGALSEMRFKVPTRGADSSFYTFPVSINQVAPDFVSLAELLSQSGYVTARFGKWHIGDDNQGFHINSANGIVGDISNTGGDEKRYYSDTMVAQKMTDASIEFIRDNKDKPFFLYLAHWEVHGPRAAMRDRIDYFQHKIEQHDLKNANAVYAAEVEQLDVSVGRINETLRQLNLQENTMVIFASDNGGVSDITSNLPLRGGKGTFYEGGIRTPCVIKWKGVIQQGSISDVPVNGVDFLPTFAALTDANLPDHQPVDGKSILPLLEGQPMDEIPAMFFHFPLYLGGGNKDLVLPSFQGIKNYWRAVPLTVIIKGEWKLIYYYEYEKYELYNLKDDISESKELSATYPEKAQALLDQLFAWTKEVNAPIPQIENEN